MQMLRIVYKKPSNGAFITIESVLVKEDEDYIHLECGKYIKNNIVSITRVQPVEETERRRKLIDDA